MPHYSTPRTVLYSAADPRQGVPCPFGRSTFSLIEGRHRRFLPVDSTISCGSGTRRKELAAMQESRLYGTVSDIIPGCTAG